MKRDEIIKLLELFEIFNFNIKQIEQDMKILETLLKKYTKNANY
jgi:hypothetical protein